MRELTVVALVAVVVGAASVAPALADDGPTLGPQGNGYAASVTDTDTDTAPGVVSDVDGHRRLPTRASMRWRLLWELTCADGTFKIHSWIELPDGTTN